MITQRLMNDRRRLFIVASTIAAVGVLCTSVALAFAFHFQDRSSCQRTAGTRKGLVIFFNGAETRATQRSTVDHGLTLLTDEEAVVSAQKAVAAEMVPDCSGLFP